MTQKSVNRCVACGAEGEWDFSKGEIFIPGESSEERLVESLQPSVPRGLKVTVPCANCGYVMFFDAATIGVNRF